MRIRPVRLRSREVPALAFTGAFASRLGLGLAIVAGLVLAAGAGHGEVAAALAIGIGICVVVEALRFVRRCRADLPDAPRTAVRVVGFTDPFARGVVVRPVDGGPRLAVPDAWSWREDLVVGDVLTWLGPLADPGGRRPWLTPARGLRCPGRTHALRHAQVG